MLPDGKGIIFMSRRPASRSSNIRAMDLDGSNKRQIMTGELFCLATSKPSGITSISELWKGTGGKNPGAARRRSARTGCSPIRRQPPGFELSQVSLLTNARPSVSHGPPEFRPGCRAPRRHWAGPQVSIQPRAGLGLRCHLGAGRKRRSKTWSSGTGPATSGAFRSTALRRDP